MELFGVKETISSLVQEVAVPNVGLRGTIITIATHHVSCIAHNAPFSPEHEMEQFEDNPFEYVQLDLSLPSVKPRRRR
jgi:exportin-2 (importin alpha re-exporter)